MFARTYHRIILAASAALFSSAVLAADSANVCEDGSTYVCDAANVCSCQAAKARPQAYLKYKLHRLNQEPPTSPTGNSATADGEEPATNKRRKPNNRD